LCLALAAALTTIAGPIHAATNARAYPLSDTAIQLEWEYAGGDETGFRIDRRVGWSGAWTIVEANLAPGTFTFQDTGLYGATEYFYRVVTLRSANLTSGLARAVTDSFAYGYRQVIFQDGINAYTGTVDVGILEREPANARKARYVWVDKNTVASGEGELQALMRFTDIFGTDTLQVPTDAKLVRAFLRLWLGNEASVESPGWMLFHEMLVPWDDNSAWNYAAWGGNGVHANGVEARATPVAEHVFLDKGVYHEVDVTSSIEAWKAGAANHGWVIRTTSTNGYGHYTSHSTSINERPQLIVEYDTDPDNQYPAVVAVHAPAHLAVTVTDPARIDIEVADPNNDALEVVLYGRQTEGDRDFRVVLLPDTQFYTAHLNGGLSSMFVAQTDWIVANHVEQNIGFVLHLGDISQDGDVLSSGASAEYQWVRAASAMYRLENPATTGLPEGIPYGVVIGNHDWEPIWRSSGASIMYNKYFGYDRFKDRSYYGGRYGTQNNNNYYQVYQVGSQKFVSISIAYHDPGRDTTDPGVLEWADAVLKAHPDRIGIVVHHHTINTVAEWGPYALVIYEVLKDNPNFRLFLGGHITGESIRADTYEGNLVYTVLADYQGWTNGGNGFLRVMTFSPRANELRFNTYSPHVDQHLPASDLTVPFDFGTEVVDFAELYRTTVPAGSRVQYDWAGILPGASYEWYAVVSDGRKSVMTDVLEFTGTHFNYELWRATYFTAEDPAGDPTADPDHDGYANLLEFLLDADPLDASRSPNMPVLQAAAGNTVISYRRAILNQHTWTLQVSLNLVDWQTPATAGVTISETLQPDGMMEAVQLEIQAPETIFIRFLVE
jgi:hypothetical protein